MKHIQLFEDFLNEAKYIKLNSVGSAIDNDGNVYPQLKNGKPDLDNGVEFSEVSDEWIESLSSADRKLVSKFESFISGIDEGRVPKMFLKHGAVVKKIRELEDKQKELATPYFKAKDEGDKDAMKAQMELMRKNQKELDGYRKNLASIEAKYIHNSEMPWDK